MSKAEDFRQYAEEAMGWARKSVTAKEKLALVNLARTWTQAAERYGFGAAKGCSSEAAR
jgi:hypothetical protein